MIEGASPRAVIFDEVDLEYIKRRYGSISNMEVQMSEGNDQDHHCCIDCDLGDCCRDCGV
jgi:hypothetical protein